MIMSLDKTLESLKNIKVKLTVPLVSGMILDGKNQREISRACNVSDAWVSEFITKNYDEILVIVDPTGRSLALKSKNVANRAIDKVDNILTTETFTKKDLLALNVTAGTQIDKFRLLQGEPTSIVNINTTNNDIKELDSQQVLIEAKIKELTG